jgi:hypothetical protein
MLIFEYPSTTASMIPKNTLIDLFYLPHLEFFVAILEQSELAIDIDGRYQKQSYRNRTSIRLANKVETLSIPVCNSRKNQAYKDVRIDYNQKWKNIHLRGIQSAYGKAPYFEYYFPYFQQVYDKNAAYLVDLNFELLTVCLSLLGLKINLISGITPEEQHNIRDIREMIQNKQDFSMRDVYHPYPYPQLFGVDFVPNLSILDLLFCMGPDSPDVLLKSQKKSLNKR